MQQKHFLQERNFNFEDPNGTLLSVLQTLFYLTMSIT